MHFNGKQIMKSDFYEILLLPQNSMEDILEIEQICHDVNDDKEFLKLYLTFNNLKRSELVDLNLNIEDCDAKTILVEVIFQKTYEELKIKYPLLFRIAKKGFTGKRADTQLGQLQKDVLYVEEINKGVNFITSNNYPFIASKSIVWVLSSANQMSQCFEILNKMIEVYKGNEKILRNLLDTRINLLFMNGVKKDFFNELKIRKPFLERIFYWMIYFVTMNPERFCFVFSILFFFIFIFFPKTFFILIGSSTLFHLLLYRISYKMSNYLLQTQFVYMGMFVNLSIIFGYFLNLILHIGT